MESLIGSIAVVYGVMFVIYYLSNIFQHAYRVSLRNLPTHTEFRLIMEGMIVYKLMAIFWFYFFFAEDRYAKWIDKRLKDL